LKDVASNVDLGTLGKSATTGTYGGSMERLASSTRRFFNSSKDQLRLKCRTVYDAISAGKEAALNFSHGAVVVGRHRAIVQPGVAERGVDELVAEACPEGSEGMLCTVSTGAPALSSSVAQLTLS
jgi:hypothetical protein